MTSNGSSAAPLLSVVMPAFNEKATILQAIAAVLSAPVNPMELIVVDDCSSDGTGELLATVKDSRVRVLRHERNRGKGAALRTGFAVTRGRFVVVQDADLEYDPRDYPIMLRPIVDGQCRRRLRHPLLRRLPPRALLLALGGQQVADALRRTCSPI